MAAVSGTPWDSWSYRTRSLGTNSYSISLTLCWSILCHWISFSVLLSTLSLSCETRRTPEVNFFVWKWKDDDLINICFICGYSRDVFEKEGISFDKHIKFEHNPSQYVNFLVYLRQKNKDEFDGTEEYVYTQYIKKKTNWVPIGHTKFIELLDEDDDTEAKIDNLDTNIDQQSK